MKITNIRLGIVATLVGLVLVVTFNQNIMGIIGQANIELQALLYASWLALCFMIGAYLPIGATVEDTEK